jgi:hypothetical protein
MESARMSLQRSHRRVPCRHGIVADPITGQGNARRIPDAVLDKDLQNAIERLKKQKEEMDKEERKKEGLRFNAGKNRMELVPPEWEWALADVTTQGSNKYDARNWEKGMDWSNMIGCMKRHIAKFLAGERYDGEEFDLEAGTTGCHHLAMVAWNALALMSYDLREIGTNDLPKLSMKLLEEVNAMGASSPSKEERDES